jgi:hypothetical protein
MGSMIFLSSFLHGMLFRHARANLLWEDASRARHQTLSHRSPETKKK